MLKKLYEILSLPEFTNFKEQENKTMIDIGCDRCALLLHMYHEKLGIKKYYALDKTLIDKDESYIHKMLFDEYIYVTGGGEMKQLREELYPVVNSQFNFYRLDLEKEIENEIGDENYDLIVFSNILHLLSKERAKEIINYFCSKLSNNGIVYIKIANENHKGWEMGKENYSGPKWGLTHNELVDITPPHIELYQDNGEGNRQILFNLKHST